MLGYRTSLPLLWPQPVRCCGFPIRYMLAPSDVFLRDVYRWMNMCFGVNPSDISWLTSEDPVKMYGVLRSGKKIQVECLVRTSKFMTNKLRLEIEIKLEMLHIRLLTQCVVERIDVRDDPFRPGYRLLRWPKPLNLRTCVINTDGSERGGRAAIGWIFRTAQGRPVKAYSALCKVMPVYVIEVWAIHEALRCAGEDMRLIVVEADATIAISLINTVAASFTDLVSKCQYNGRNYLKNSEGQIIRANNPNEDDKLKDYIKSVIIGHAHWTKRVDSDSLDFLVDALVDVSNYLQKFEGWACRHLLREANGAADRLTTIAKEGEVFISPEELTEEILRIAERDANDDTWYERVKPTPLVDNFNESSGYRLPCR